jgi:competence protein ComEC
MLRALRRAVRTVVVVALVSVLAACVPPAELDPGTAPRLVERASTAPAPPDPAATPAPAEAPEPSADSEVAAPTKGLLEIHVLDVGQGDAMLLQHPDVTLLIDTGRHDRDDVVPQLRALGVRTIDVLVVSHPHADHLGQFDRVMAAFDVAEVWWSGAEATTRTFERAVAALEASGATYEEPRGGQQTRVGPLQIDVLHPAAGDDLSSLNDASIALRITYGSFRLVTTGDAERVSEARMLARHPSWLAADVLRLGHHGSSTSTIPDLLAAVAPSVAIYSASATNSYGHPHDEVVTRVTRAGIALYGTAVHGTVTIVTDGTTFDVRTAR